MRPLAVARGVLWGSVLLAAGMAVWRAVGPALERVEPGEVIGFVGTSGNAPADVPHLHYGIYTRNGPLNPYPLLVRPGMDGPPVESRGASEP